MAVSRYRGRHAVLGAKSDRGGQGGPTRYATAKGRKAYASTAPVTRASGTRTVVAARVARNDRLANACTQWAFAAQRFPRSQALLRPPPRHRQQQRAGAAALGNRLVGILHGCLAGHVIYQEQVAWPSPNRPQPDPGGGVPGEGLPPGQRVRPHASIALDRGHGPALLPAAG